LDDNYEQEQELVRQAQAGNQLALSELVNRYSMRIYHLGLRLTGTEQDAEDVLQETFLTMLKKIRQFQGKSSFYTWLYRVAINISLRKLKSKPRKYQHVSLDDPNIGKISSFPGEEWPDIDFDIIREKHFKEKLDKAIEELPDIYKTVFILRDLHELSTDETSKILQISVSNTKIRLMRARNFLKEKLEGVVHAEGLA